MRQGVLELGLSRLLPGVCEQLHAAVAAWLTMVATARYSVGALFTTGITTVEANPRS